MKVAVPHQNLLSNKETTVKFENDNLRSIAKYENQIKDLIGEICEIRSSYKKISQNGNK